jgi:hypothetical protein
LLAFPTAKAAWLLRVGVQPPFRLVVGGLDALDAGEGPQAEELPQQVPARGRHRRVIQPPVSDLHVRSVHLNDEMANFQKFYARREQDRLYGIKPRLQPTA